jgi:hypothetical protein
MSNFAKDLIEGMTEAVAHADGKTAATVHVVEVPDVRAIRRQLHMSQHEFAEAYRRLSPGHLPQAPAHPRCAPARLTIDLNVPSPA